LEPASFVQTNRGGRKLVHDGFSFTVNRKLNENLISWKCTKYKQYGCRARAVTRMIQGVDFIKLSKPEHSHPTEEKLAREMN
jgi:hypothetical protein